MDQYESPPPPSPTDLPPVLPDHRFVGRVRSAGPRDPMAFALLGMTGVPGFFVG